MAARRNIAKQDPNVRLNVSVGYIDDKPAVTIYRQLPVTHYKKTHKFSGYKQTNVAVFVSEKIMDPFKYAQNIIIKMGKNAPKNFFINKP